MIFENQAIECERNNLYTDYNKHFSMEEKKYKHHFITVPKMEQLPFSAAEGVVTGKQILEYILIMKWLRDVTHISSI